jgi:hypothetical protein
VTEFQSRRELREAERQGLVPKPEQVFDLPTGSIRLPEANEILTRKRIREMERDGLLDPLTGSLPVSPEAEAEHEPMVPVVETRGYDEILAETEEPITSSISAVVQPTISQPAAPLVFQPVTPPVVASAKSTMTESVAATDIFHSMAVDPNARKPRIGVVLVVILLVLGGAAAAAYMLGIFK